MDLSHANLNDLDWDRLRELVERHRVAARVHAALRQQNLPPAADAFKVFLERRDRVERLQSIRHADLCLHVIRQFTAAGIDTIPLKGVFLAQRLYGDIGMRHAKDIDLLVRPEDVDPADALLQAQGFQRPPLLPGRRLTPRQQAYLRAVDYHYEYTRGDGMQVELHWRRPSWSPAQMDLLWAHSPREDWMGTTPCRMDDALLLLFLCDHGAHHRWFRIKWLSDVAVLLAQRADSDWEALLHLAQALDLERPLAQAILLVSQCGGVHLGTAMTDWAQREATAAALARDAQEAIAGGEDEGTLEGGNPRKVRFQMQLRKLRARDEFLKRLLLSPEDFKLLPLPDILFWAYYPLRPLLWILRRLPGGRMSP